MVPGTDNTAYQYDDLGRVTRKTNIDAQGNALNTAEGYASTAYGYDENDRVTLLAYYDASGALKTGSAGYAKIERAYTAQGELLEERYFGEDGILCPIKGRYGQRIEYDEAGRMSVVWFLGADGEVISQPGERAGIRYVYQEDGSRTSHYIDANGKKVQ